MAAFAFPSPGCGKYVMGILNVTPDSFFDGGRYFSTDAAVERALCIQSEGADYIDIGAQSTAPGSKAVSAEQELERLLPPLGAVLKASTLPVSVDTFYPEVARAALAAGASVINDVGGAPQDMAALAAEYSAGLIIMHTGAGVRGANAQGDGFLLPGGAQRAVAGFFANAVEQALAAGLSPSQLCLDPGIGFGKSRGDDIELSLCSDRFGLSLPLLYGVSRKRTARLADEFAHDNGATGTDVFNIAAMLGGYDIIRVHDVRRGVEIAKTVQLITACRSNDTLI